jgi:hypothetical protein
MSKRWFLFLPVLCGWSVWASLTGDLNGDGAVNIADWVQAQKISGGELTFDPAADVDGDSVVTDIDLFLIQEAVLGRPIPELVDSATIGSSGGTLSHENITFTIPPGSSGQTHLALMRCADDALDDETPLHEVYMVCGLSTNLAGFSVSYANCGTDTGLSAGAHLKPYDTGEMQWYWQVFADTDFVRNGSQVSRTFAAPGTADLAISHSLKVALVTADAPPPLIEAAPAKAMSEAIITKGLVSFAESGVPGTRYAGYRDTGWVSDLFEVYTADWGTVTYTHLETVCGYLYDIYNKIQSIGFPLATEHASIFPIVVRVGRGIKGDGGSVNNPVTGSHWLEVNASLLSNPGELKATLGHEVMHYVLNEYTRGDNFAFECMEDAITTWFEAVAAGNPDHRSGNYTSRRAAPLKSLFVPISRSWYGARNWGAQEKHGYALSAFVDYHFDHRRDWIYSLATKVKGGQTIERALNSLFTENLGVLQDLERNYLVFARDYLMTATGTYSADVSSDAIFASDSSTDVSKMYKLISIKKASTNLLEKQEVDLKIQDYGSGVIQFKLFKPDRLFAPHTKLRVTAPEICNSIDLLMQTRNSDGVTQSEIVTGVYGPNDEGENEWSCVIPLQQDAQFILLSVLATVANEGQLSDYAEEHEITLTYQFEGDYYMPMQESFVRWTELSSSEAYYDNQIICDAIVRILGPDETAGLDHFAVERTADNYPRPAENYTINWAISGMAASRRTTDAFQIQLFSDVTVPDLQPYTVNISTDGYSPVTRDYQTPLIAGDGTPRMELMVYYASEASQVYPGEEAFRIQHVTTSAANLRQSADGLFGGVPIDIPAQIDGYRCLIYLIASEEDGTLGHTAFVMSIFPKEEGQ